MKKYVKPVLFKSNTARVCGRASCGRWPGACGKLIERG